jgi:ribose-phosphate pyrophosphokinase
MGGSKEPMRILNFRVRCNLLQTKKRSNVIDTMELIGEVKGRNVILVDDMIDTEALWRKPQI